MDVPGLTVSVVEYLRVHIITCDIAPGQKLKEPELASRLSISRSPLREAFRILENEHLIVSIPRKGCYAAEVSMESCREIFQAREMIESYAIKLFKEKNIRELPHVASVLKETSNLHMPTSSDPYEKFKYLKTIANFHINLVKAAGNSRLSNYFDSLFPSLARYQSMYTYIPGLMNVSQKVH